MEEGYSTLVQYAYLDIVRFTQGRTVEAQVDVIRSLNKLVREGLGQENIGDGDCILLPTGDGICIAIPRAAPFDTALRVAAHILNGLATHNSGIKDSKRQFSIRIGINQNIDNLLVDINGNPNVAGRGINMAERIMNLADGGQILVGQPAHEVLCEREIYLDSFREFEGGDKHGNRFSVFQYRKDGVQGLNTDIPERFRPKETPPTRLNSYSAHFIANAVCHQRFLLSHRQQSGFEYAAVILLHLLTLDSMDAMNRSPYESPRDRVKRAPDGSPYPMYKSVDESEFWLRAELASCIHDRIREAGDCFEGGEYVKLWPFPSENGKKRVQQEHPDVWARVVAADAETGPAYLPSPDPAKE
ncbi:MAG: hypothetical protein HYR72_22600 [Deltaproteobacteria bacterium]|nr:hypothetical protein [Deltaproteobacteria bacterium]MBI3390638.1 hypothetical protein [Deltaproteobacteria bacterium]